MRARWLKPEFFTDRKMGVAGPVVALVYQALWCAADDGGMAPCDPERIKGELFVYWGAIGVPEITGALRHLSDTSRIEFYHGGDDWFAQIVRWTENQPVHKPSKFRYREDYAKRGKKLERGVPEWCGSGAAPVPEGLGTTPLPDTQTPRHPESQTPSSETTSPTAAPSPPEKPNAWKADAAVTLRKAGIIESEIGDAIKNWWVPARRRFTDPEIAAVVSAHGRQFAAKGETWNPARVWNPRNADFDERFRYAIAKQALAEKRSPTRGIKTVQQIIGGAA